MLRDRPLARLRPLIHSKAASPQDAMATLARAMHGLPGKGRLRITSLGGKHSTSWTVNHLNRKASVERAGARKSTAATCEVLASDETLRAILAGELSPLEAFVQDRLRIRGDVEYARVVLRHLASSSDASTEVCD